MLGKTNILIIAEFFIFNHISYALSRRLNLTQLIRESFGEGPLLYRHQYSQRNIPVLRDVSYLPEEDYNMENEAKYNELQQLERNNRNLMPEYRHLCETIIKKKDMSDDADYEYQPPHYHEVFCKNYMTEDEQISKRFSQKCAYPGFHCVQRSRIQLLLRRRWDSECWEPYPKEIASGCDCMWPVKTLGEITGHY